MALADRVYVARRFQRAVRIDTDLGEPKALEGFICPHSSADVLLTMARHIAQTKQGAFTWTGPYGSGKSSLVVALSALLSTKKALRAEAESVFGKDVAETVRAAMPAGSKGWQVLAVVGRRDDPVRVIGEAIEAAELEKAEEWTGEKIVQTLWDAAERHPRSSGGLIVFIDEMGKFLEAAAQEGTDIYLFQQLAEMASRSKGRLIVVGILHQAFEEYAHRLSREMRDEWAKIQGRFVDLAVNTAGEEQIELLSRAIESDHRPKRPGKLAKTIAGIVRPQHGQEAKRLAERLEECWPLHPVVACLLGPISRRRFGQNQRSLFGFLNSAEPQGFQDFIKKENEGAVYEPDRLWDYLRINLEPSILASPDGHRWALAAEAIERCEVIGGDELHLKLLKTIAVVDLFKERSSLTAGEKLLFACVPGHTDKAVKQALEQLGRWSFVIFKKFLSAYAIFAGSDFDIDGAVETALEEVTEINFAALKSFAGLHPVVAKRHYHDTGALRWFDVSLAPLCDLSEVATNYQPGNGAIGQFLFAFPTLGESEENAEELCREAARQSKSWDNVVGLSQRAWGIVDLARELLALEKVRNDHPELAGDAVARREVLARLSTLQSQLEGELQRALDSAKWFRKHHPPKQFLHAELNALASDLADKRYNSAPRLHNELLNRQKPSSNAVAAQNALLKRMVMKEGEPRLGIEGFPAEGGLFASLLEANGLYKKNGSAWQYCWPEAASDESYRLAPIWEAARSYLKENADRTVAVSEIFKLWRAEPYGVKDGLMPVLAVAFILSKRDKVAVYREGIFQAHFKDLDVEFLARDAGDIQLRWMNLSDVSRRLLSGMASVVRELDPENDLTNLEPIDVARGLVAIHDNLRPWTKRTTRLSANAIKVRTLFKQASDPNKFLFDDIPSVLEQEGDLAGKAGIRKAVSVVRDGLAELVEAYPAMLRRLQEMMLAELEVPNASPQALDELRNRAENIKQLSGDFRLDAFAGRLAQFTGTDDDMEGIASLAANKPPQDWVDPDLDRAAIEIAAMAQSSVRLETFAHIKGRPNKRHTLAVVIGSAGARATVLEEFDIGDSDRQVIEELITRIELALAEGDMSRRNVILAALAEISTSYMQTAPGKDGSATKRRRAVS